MSRRDDEKDFRLRPRKPRVLGNQNDSHVWATAFKRIVHFARTSRKGAHGKKALRQFRPSRLYFQRCSVRVSYSRNATAGQWRAHGRYVERESAACESDRKSVGFGPFGKRVDVSSTLADWQASGDQRLWKLIISPEFGDRLDLERLTWDVLGQMEKDTRSRLEWVAVAHYNTEHPHVHVALRGRAGENQSLNLNREYVKHGIRQVAENFCTRQLGPRTALDVAEAERREVNEKRFTSLDRKILAEAPDDDSPWFEVVRDPARSGLSETARFQEQRASARLSFLETMGLADSVRPNAWRVRRDFVDILRTMQRTSDHQKMLAAHGVLMSDERLPITVMDWDKTDFVEGRILVHGQDDSSGRSYLMLEGTDLIVHLIHYTPEMEKARHQGGLRTNSFVSFCRNLNAVVPMVEIEDFDNADDLLRNDRLISDRARRLINRGVVPSEDGWGGWLGRYQAGVRKASQELARESELKEQKNQQRRQREKDRSCGR